MDITEGIKKIFLAGVGAVATTGEAAKNLIDTLVEKGELTVEQGKILNEEMKKNAKEKASAIHRFFSFLFSFLHPFLILFNWAILESSIKSRIMRKS